MEQVFHQQIPIQEHQEHSELVEIQDKHTQQVTIVMEQEAEVSMAVEELITIHLQEHVLQEEEEAQDMYGQVQRQVIIQHQRFQQLCT